MCEQLVAVLAAGSTFIYKEFICTGTGKKRKLINQFLVFDFFFKPSTQHRHLKGLMFGINQVLSVKPIFTNHNLSLRAHRHRNLKRMETSEFILKNMFYFKSMFYYFVIHSVSNLPLELN